MILISHELSFGLNGNVDHANSRVQICKIGKHKNTKYIYDYVIFYQTNHNCF